MNIRDFFTRWVLIVGLIGGLTVAVGGWIWGMMRLADIAPGWLTGTVLFLTVTGVFAAFATPSK